MIHNLTQADLQRYNDIGILLEQIGYYMTITPHDKKYVEVNLHDDDGNVIEDVIIYRKSESTPGNDAYNKGQFAKIYKVYQTEKAYIEEEDSDKEVWKEYVERVEAERETARQEAINYELERLEGMRATA